MRAQLRVFVSAQSIIRIYNIPWLQSMVERVTVRGEFVLIGRHAKKTFAREAFVAQKISNSGMNE